MRIDGELMEIWPNEVCDRVLGRVLPLVAVVETWCVVVVMVMVMGTHILMRYWIVLDPG